MCVDPAERRDNYPLRGALAGKECKAEAMECGSCYCGKFQNRDVLARKQAEWHAEYPQQPSDPHVDSAV